MDADTLLIFFCLLLGVPQIVAAMYILKDSPEHGVLMLPWLLSGGFLIWAGIRILMI